MDKKRKYEENGLYPEGTFLWGKENEKTVWAGVTFDHRDGGYPNPKENYRWVFWFGDERVTEMHVNKLYSFVDYYKVFYLINNKRSSQSRNKTWRKGVIDAIREYGRPLTDDWNENQLLLWAEEDFVATSTFIHQSVVPLFVKKILLKYKEYNTKNQILLKKLANDVQKKMIVECLTDRSAYCNYTFCFGCYDVTCSEEHPVFEGNICNRCLNNLKLIIHSYDSDGVMNYCIVCATSGFAVACNSLKCRRLFCLTCLKDLAAPGASELILKSKEWYCFLCKQNEKICGLLRPRKDWKQILYNLFGENNAVLIQSPAVPKIKRKVRVLSLFDGIGTGLLTLKKLDISVEAYFVSETKDSAKDVVKTNFPGENIVMLGDIKLIDEAVLKTIIPIDLVLAGSPCNDLSGANPYRKGLTGKFLQCVPVNINAVELSPQNRSRLFWGNLPSLENTVFYGNGPSLQTCLSPNRTAIVEKLRTVTTKSNSLLQGPDASHPVLSKNDTPDNIWISELEKVFGFPEHYTDVGNLSFTKRQELLGKAWSVHTLMRLFRCLRDYFKTD